MKNNIRICIALLLLVQVPLLTPLLHGQQAGDAICKGDPIPAGLVPISDMKSPECTIHTPYEKNAWILGPIVEGVSSCTAPDYENDPGLNLRFIACGRKETPGCNRFLDGTPNGQTLRTLNTCPSLHENCGAYPPKGAVFSVSVIPIHSDVCGRSPGTNAIRYKHLDPGESVPVCGFQKHIPMFFDPDQSDVFIDGYPRDIQSDRLIIVREFFNPDCGDTNAYGLNAVVVKRIITKRNERVKVFACSLTIIDALRSTDPNAFHDDRCGITNGKNAVTLELKPKGE